MADGLVHGTVTIDDKTVTAEYIIMGSEAYLGSGNNACIPQYSVGNVVVPAAITYNNQEYKNMVDDFFKANTIIKINLLYDFRY